MKHLFVDISSHGYGHLAQTAPVLNALLASRSMRLTIRCGLATAQLQRRIRVPFTHIQEASDFGFVMHDALQLDLAASAARYQIAYADWSQHVASEARLLESLAPDLVLSNISPLPLAGAAQAGIPAIAMCSLNWTEMFAHYYADQNWAAPIQTAMHDAYTSATAFLRLTPGMDMPGLANVHDIGPVSIYADGKAHLTRSQVANKLKLPEHKRWLLIALGGIAHRLPIEDWPELENVQLLIPADWNVQSRDDCTAYSDAQIPFADLLPTVDAVLSKPGYGTFVEAASCGLPVLYLQRSDWPESACLEAWLHRHTRAAIIPPEAARNGDIAMALDTLLASAAPPKPAATGIAEALHYLNQALDRSDTMTT